MHAHSELARYRPTATKVHVDIKLIVTVTKQCLFLKWISRWYSLHNQCEGQGMRLNLHSTVGCLHACQVTFKLSIDSVKIKCHCLGQTCWLHYKIVLSGVLVLVWLHLFWRMMMVWANYSYSTASLWSLVATDRYYSCALIPYPLSLSSPPTPLRVCLSP